MPDFLLAEHETPQLSKAIKAKLKRNETIVYLSPAGCASYLVLPWVSALYLSECFLTLCVNFNPLSLYLYLSVSVSMSDLYLHTKIKRHGRTAGEKETVNSPGLGVHVL